MKQVLLFDWGNTLMIDFPHYAGKMYLWPQVEAVDEAKATLKALSHDYDLYVATSAQDSSEAEIQAAFQRVGLDDHISGYFCKANLSLNKDNPEFYRTIVNLLGQSTNQVTMVGDTLEKDIYPALQAGLRAIYFNPQHHQVTEDIVTIQCLSQLLEHEW